MARSAQVVAFSTSPSMAADIDRVAAEDGVSRSALIRAAVEHYLAVRPAGASPAHEARSVYTPAYRVPAPPHVGLQRVLDERPAIAELCTRHGVRRLWLYGSAVRGEFVPGTSDYDFLVEFVPGFDLGPWATHLFELGEELEGLLSAKVDIGQAVAIANPYLRSQIEGERVLIYESA